MLENTLRVSYLRQSHHFYRGRIHKWCPWLIQTSSIQLPWMVLPILLLGCSDSGSGGSVTTAPESANSIVIYQKVSFVNCVVF